jgi:hypothetical protein
MSKPKHIQISIPHPCSENWDEMTPEARGRFCAHCQKTVIDFTAWSDTDLYNFFSKRSGDICGRFLGTQIDHPLSIPYQPHSRLYRLTIALGLTLTLSQTPQLHAQNRPPWLPVERILPVHKHTSDSTLLPAMGSIRGRILDEKNEPIINAVIRIYSDGALKGGVVSDYDGLYHIKSLEPGSYDLLVNYIGYDSIKVTGLKIWPDATTTQNFKFKKSKIQCKISGLVVFTGYTKMLDMDNPTKRTYTREDLDQLPLR